MKTAFFCDTGILYALCYPSDIHYTPCKKFIKRYPFSNYNYYIPQLVLKELENHKNKLDKSRKVNKQQRAYARAFQQCIDRRVAKMKRFDYTQHAKYHQTFQTLVQELKLVINAISQNQLNDVEIVSHAIIWSIVSAYEEKILVTVDGTDLSNNQEKIVAKAIEIAGCDVHLEIIYIPALFTKTT